MWGVIQLLAGIVFIGAAFNSGAWLLSLLMGFIGLGIMASGFINIMASLGDLLNVNKKPQDDLPPRCPFRKDDE